MTVSVTHASQVSITTTSAKSTRTTTTSAVSSTAPNTAIMAIALTRSPSPCNSSGSDTDAVANSSSSTTALRRLYFKTGRSSKAKTPAVPKVVVMGSSTTSTTETTLNTSTESASTLVTNVTATDTSEACDSLDYGETSGQSEPLLSSLDEPTTTVSIRSVNSSNEEEHNLITNEQDMPILVNYERKETMDQHATPRTAPITSSTHFPFDPPLSPRSMRTLEKAQPSFTFAEASKIIKSFNEKSEKECRTRYGSERDFKKRRDQRSSVIRRASVDQVQRQHQTIEESRKMADNYELSKQQRTKELAAQKGKNRSVNAVKTSSTSSSSSSSNKENLGSLGKINSAPAVASCGAASGKKPYVNFDKNHDTTMFPFDREAIDYERIQRECFAVEEETQFPFDFQNEPNDYDSDSSVYEKLIYPSSGGGVASPSKGAKNQKLDQLAYDSNTDIYEQYALLSQQETYHKYEKRPSKRSNGKHRHSYNLDKHDHHAMSSMVDAFSPKPAEYNCSNNNNHSTNNHSDNHTVSRFEQIISKFEQFPQKSSDAFHHLYHNNHHQHQLQHHGHELVMMSPSGMTGNAAASGAGVGAGQRGTSPLPDLRVDFFAESRNEDLLDGCQKVVSAATTTHNSAGPINVTPNPMDTAVCTQPRATIVVQQASLSLDNTVETFLLKNEGDFVSVEQGKDARKKKQREENMRQLLDVTNTLTSEEIRDFEMRYGSPHHSRSQSVKTPGSRASGRPNQLSLPQQRSRVASMPNTGVEEEYYRLRHFSITGKGVVNRGDSLKSRRSRSNNSVASSNSSTEHLTANPPAVGSARTSATCSLASSRESSTSNPGNGPYRVLMLGGTAVGKSSLVSQFMTSEYLHAYDTSIDDESGEKAVSVLLSGEESELVFIDHASTEMSPENCLSSYDPHGYCVIYSSADRGSFMVVERVLQALWTTENIAQKAVILVGNKADLARSRVVTFEEGKAMATAYDCKFIETSVGINHNVDELLVGLLSQIRLKLENPEKSRDLFRKRSCRKSKRRACSPLGSATACLTGNGNTNPSTPISVGPQHIAANEFNTPPGSVQNSPRKYRGSRTSASLKVKGLLGRVWARDSKSKSCENLHVL